MLSDHPFLEQIDHVGIHLPDPVALFRFCTEVLGLPALFPYTEYPNYLSGSVALGNMYLELVHFGAAAGRPADPGRYLILGFLNRPGTLAGSLAELARRRILHSGLAPFFAPEASDEIPVAIWSNVFLGGLLGANAWMRLFFALSKTAPIKPSQQRSRLGIALSGFLLKRSFRQGMAVLTEYHRQVDRHRQALDGSLLQQSGGGLLGIECVREVVVGVPEAAQIEGSDWARFLAPLRPDATGQFRIGPGPALRFVPAPQRGIQTIVVQVRDREKAQTALDAAGIPVRTDGGELALLLPHADGLSMRLAGGRGAKHDNGFEITTDSAACGGGWWGMGAERRRVAAGR